MRRLGTLAALCALLVVTGCGAQSEPTQSTPPPTAPALEVTPLVGSVTFAPIPFKGSDGLTHLVYELSVTNFTSGELTIKDVAVLDAASGKQIGERDAASLQHRVYPAGSREATNVLQTGQAAVVFMHVPLADEKQVPQKLTHRVELTGTALPGGRDQLTEQIAGTAVDRRTLPVLSAPLVGERYVGADGCCDAPRHTRAMLPINGQLYLAQRYAVDFEQANATNRLFTGDPKDPKSYQIFGKQVFAVADGTVVGTRNDLPEQTPGTYPANIGIDEADGNFVVLDIGNGFFVNYAHMQPGSVRPKVGDKVKRGDVIGLVGNSGNSVAPHLHVHVMDGPSPLAAQGLPYLYDAFTTTGQVASTGVFDTAEATGVPLALTADASRTDHTDEMVLDQNLVTFAR